MQQAGVDQGPQFQAADKRNGPACAFGANSGIDVALKNQRKRREGRVVVGIGVPVGDLRMLCQEDAVGGEFQRGPRLFGKTTLQRDPLRRGFHGTDRLPSLGGRSDHLAARRHNPRGWVAFGLKRVAFPNWGGREDRAEGLFGFPLGKSSFFNNEFSEACSLN